jgi:hypothetical protein
MYTLLTKMKIEASGQMRLKVNVEAQGETMLEIV